jgi:hypothetical protein
MAKKKGKNKSGKQNKTPETNTDNKPEAKAESKPATATAEKPKPAADSKPATGYGQGQTDWSGWEMLALAGALFVCTLGLIVLMIALAPGH